MIKAPGAEKQKGRHPDKIVLVMDDRDVFLCAEKLGDFVRVIRKRDLDFARAVDLVKSDFWFGKGTLFMFLGGVFSSIKVRKHSTCAQYKCEIPVRVYHIEKDTPANIIIDDALQLHKVILDSTTNDQVFFCDLLPVNVDSHNVLKVDKRLCYSTHPIDFHKKVPIRFLDQYTDSVNEFNKFVEKHTNRLGFKFESLVAGTFGKTFTDIKFAFSNMSTDGVTLKEAYYKQRCSSIISMVEAVRNQLHSEVSKNDPRMVKLNERTIEKSNFQFDKVAIIANSYYNETLTHFASDKVVVFADEDLKFEGIEKFILEKKRNLPEKTLWLTLIGSFCISEIKYHDACKTKLSCKEPLITLVPSPEVKNLSSLPETIRKIKESTLALLEKVRGLIGPKSAFFIIPPYPPTIVSELSFTHSDLHSLKCEDTQIYVASEEVIIQLNLAFTRLSKEIISLVMKEFQNHKLKCSSIESYSKSLPVVGHLQIVRRKSDSRSSLFNKWQDCVKDMICEFVDCSIKEIPIPVRNTKKFDHLIFIGHQNLLNQLSDRSGAKFSIFNLNYPINFEFLQMKLNSLKSISNKPMLFVIACDFSLIAKEVFDAKCNNLKCSNMMSFFASESKDIKTVISDKLLNIRNMILKIKDMYPVNATVIIAPLFSRHCVERPAEINETVHRTLHVILKHVCSPCVLEGPRKYWEDGTSLLQYYLRDEVLSNLYIRNDNEPLISVIESILSLDAPYIQWIKPVVAPITDKFKYNIKILFDKLCEVVYANKGLNDTAKGKSSVTETAKNNLTKAVKSVESKKIDNKNSIPVVNTTGKSTITGKPVPTIQERTLVTPNKKTSNVTAKTSNQTSRAKTLQNTSIQNTSTQNTSTQNASTNYQVPTVPYTYNAMSEPYNSFGMNQGFYPSNSYSYYFPNQPPPQQPLPSVGMLQQPPPMIHQPPPLVQIPPPAYPYQFPPNQQNVDQQQYYSAPTDLNYSYSNNFNNSTQASYTQSQPSISDMLSSSVSQVASIALPSAQVVQPLSSMKVSSASKNVPQSTTGTTVIRSVVKNIVIENPKELVDFLSEFGSNTWRDRPYEHAFVIGKKELIEPLSSQDLKNVKFVYQNLASLDEGQVSFLIKKMGAIPHRSVCFLAFSLSIIMKTTPMTPGCKKFKCKQPVPGSCLKSQSHLSQHMNIISRIKNIVNLASKMAGYIPVIVLPIFPAKVFVDDAYSLPYHKISHAITDKNSYVLIGERKEWEDSIGIFLQTWNNFIKVHHDKYTYPKALPKYPYLKDTITIKDKVKEFFEEDNQPTIWENTVKKIIKILMSYTEGSNIEKTITITKTEETTINNLSSSTDTSTQTVVKVWNVSESIPEKFFDFLFKAIDPKADLEKIVENDEYYYLVKLTKVSAILITRKLENILIGDSTLRVCLIHNQDDYPELTFAQEKYISSMFQDAYSRFKSQIMRNIKNKLLNGISDLMHDSL
ncbi:hypothetical protein Avbf_11500 [Armadillidium vulgare]|nr:hypothetical protein Avbf_11500 [Armadillidium vulgare]